VVRKRGLTSEAKQLLKSRRRKKEKSRVSVASSDIPHSVYLEHIQDMATSTGRRGESPLTDFQRIKEARRRGEESEYERVPEQGQRTRSRSPIIHTQSAGMPTTSKTSSSIPSSGQASETLKRLAEQKKAEDAAAAAAAAKASSFGSAGTAQAKAPPTSSKTFSSSKPKEFQESARKLGKSPKSSTEESATFAKPSGPAPKRPKVGQVPASSKHSVPPSGTDSDTDYYDSIKRNNYEFLVAMSSRSRSKSVDRKFMKKAVETTERVGTKPRALNRALTKGESALNEATILEESASESVMIEAMNYLIHFITPKECILFLDLIEIRNKPDRPTGKLNNIQKLVSCVRKRLNCLGERFNAKTYQPKDEIDEGIICHWNKGTSFDARSLAKIVKKADAEYRGGETHDEEAESDGSKESVEPAESEKSASSTKNVSFEKAKQTTPIGTRSYAGGQSRTEQYFAKSSASTAPSSPPPKVSSTTSTGREKLSCSETSGYKEQTIFDSEEVDQALEMPSSTSSHDQEIMDAMKHERDAESWKFSTVMLEGDKRLQGELFVKWWNDYKPGSGMNPVGLINPPEDCYALLGKYPGEENDSKFTKGLVERYKEAYYQYIALKQCAHRMVNHCKNMDTIFQPDYMPFIKGLRIGIINHFRRLKHFSAFNLKHQTGDMLSILRQLEECFLVLEKAQFDPVIQKDPKERNTIEVRFRWTNEDGTIHEEKKKLPKGWDEAQLEVAHPLSKAYAKHYTLESVGTFDGGKGSDFFSWWLTFKDSIHRVPGVSNTRKHHELTEKLLTGRALKIFNGSKTMMLSFEREYVRGMSRLNNEFNRVDNRWEKLCYLLEKFKVVETDPDAIKEKIYELENLKDQMVNSKPISKTTNDVARTIHYRIHEIFTGNLLDKIRTHVATVMNKQLLSGQFNEVVSSYLEELHKVVSSSMFRAEAPRSALNEEDQKALKFIREQMKAKGSSSQGNNQKPGSKPFTPSQGKRPPFPPNKKYEPKPKGHISQLDGDIAESEEETEKAEEELLYHEQSESRGTEEIKSELELLKQQFAAMANTQQQVMPVPMMYYPPQMQMQTTPVLQQVMAAEAAPDAAQVTDPEAVRRIIEDAKKESCIFTHRTQGAKPHLIWNCASQPLQKAEELATLNRCRTCWQSGHTGLNCIVKPTILCDHCKGAGHWQPFCGSFISDAITKLKARKAAAEEPKQQLKATESMDLNGSYEKYVKRMESQAAHSSRVIAANSMTSSTYALKGGASLAAVGKVLTPKPVQT
jgi:hypothetical protein